MIPDIDIPLRELFKIHPWIFSLLGLFSVSVFTFIVVLLYVSYREFKRIKSVELTPKFWQRYFKTYDILNRVIPYQELLKVLCEELEMKPGELILEAGSGTGNLVLEMEKYGVIVVGFDFSEVGLKIHKEKKANARVILGDLTCPLPFQDNSFDKIVSSNTLYLISPEKLINIMWEFFRILKPGGKIVIANLRKGFNPRFIYLNHIKKIFRQMGILWAGVEIIILAVPTIKMFYYSYHLQKYARTENSFRFFDFDEQEKHLLKSGFIDVSETKNVFSSQGILTAAFKPE